MTFCTIESNSSVGTLFFLSRFRDLYTLSEKWFSLWNKMLSLEDRSTNVKRLNNRGGQLLKEEKERKAVQKVST